jgi:hypothetical protein
MPGVLDGHESHAGYRRHGAGCLERTVRTKQGDGLQFYHRNVTLMLLAGAPPGRPPVHLLLDAEPQRPGEDDWPTPNTPWWFSRMSVATFTKMSRASSHGSPRKRAAIAPASAAGETSPIWSPGPRSAAPCG